MSSSNLKTELADHIYKYLCHEAQYSDLPEAARESLTAASECIEQAYKLNVNNTSCNNNTNTNNNQNKQQSDCGGSKYGGGNLSSSTNTNTTTTSSILPDELLRIFTRHKEFLFSQQQRDSSSKYSSRNENDQSVSMEKPEIRLNNNPPDATASNDSHNSSSSNPSGVSPNLTTNAATIQAPAGVTGGQLGQPQLVTTSTKQHSQHPISQLPMTTRKKLSHLRAQIKRQASKAARSRLEKRSSVSGVGVTNTTSGERHFSGAPMGSSLDATNLKHQQAGDGYNAHHHHHHHKELSSQQNSSSSTESPNAYLSNQSTSSPLATGGGVAMGGNETGTGTNLTPSHHANNESGPSSSGGHKQSGQSVSGGNHHQHHAIGVSVHQKNFKQKLIALLKKFRTDGSDFDSEEQYREALERELMKAAAGRGSRAIEELLEEDIDVEEESSSEPEDWDNISESSTPKPSLRPFFSSTTLDKI